MFLAALSVAVAVTSAVPVFSATDGSSATANATRGPVLIVVVVDQLAAWMADERWSALPADGGFARLRREGLYVRDLRFGHAATDTAPGHSALFTGAVPRDSGMLSNEVVPPAGGDPISFLSDDATHVLPAGGKPGGGGGEAKTSSSLHALRVQTLADALRQARPDATIISLSLKDRGALFGGGRHPTASLWLDPGLGVFVTSTAIADAFPSWATPLADAAAVRAQLAAPWQLADRDWVAAHAETAEDGKGESDYQGLGRVFPHPVTSAKALRATPGGDRLLFALAEAAATQLAAADQGGLLVVSLSAHDYVVHLFGPHSWEAWDELARLDQALGIFLSRLDGLFGPAGYSFMLTGDHGSNALPEVSGTGPGPWCPHAAPPPITGKEAAGRAAVSCPDRGRPAGGNGAGRGAGRRARALRGGDRRPAAVPDAASACTARGGSASAGPHRRHVLAPALRSARGDRSSLTASDLPAAARRKLARADLRRGAPRGPVIFICWWRPGASSTRGWPSAPAPATGLPTCTIAPCRCWCGHRGGWRRDR